MQNWKFRYVYSRKMPGTLNCYWNCLINFENAFATINKRNELASKLNYCCIWNCLKTIEIMIIVWKYTHNKQLLTFLLTLNWEIVKTKLFETIYSRKLFVNWERNEYPIKSQFKQIIVMHSNEFSLLWMWIIL